MKFHSFKFCLINLNVSPSSRIFLYAETFVCAIFFRTITSDQSFVRIFFAEFPFDIILYIYSILQPATTAPVRED